MQLILRSYVVLLLAAYSVSEKCRRMVVRYSPCNPDVNGEYSEMDDDVACDDQAVYEQKYGRNFIYHLRSQNTWAIGRARCGEKVKLLSVTSSTVDVWLADEWLELCNDGTLKASDIKITCTEYVDDDDDDDGDDDDDDDEDSDKMSTIAGAGFFVCGLLITLSIVGGVYVCVKKWKKKSSSRRSNQPACNQMYHVSSPRPPSSAMPQLNAGFDADGDSAPSAPPYTESQPCEPVPTVYGQTFPDGPPPTYDSLYSPENKM